jgi:hypothetical protein
MDRQIKGNGGLVIPREMYEVLQRNKGYISTDNGGQILADAFVKGKLSSATIELALSILLFLQESGNFSAQLLSDFALACYIGHFDAVVSVRTYNAVLIWHH